MSYDEGRFVWFELVSRNSEKAQGFYGELFGWKTQLMDMPGGMQYPLILAGEHRIGGQAPAPSPSTSPHWVSYVSVDDVDAAAKRVEKAGGTCSMGAFDVPGVGRMQPVVDPLGAPFFLFRGQQGDPPPATGPGTFHWNELITPDPKRAAAFYREALGHEVDETDMGMGPYHILRNGEAMRGGITAPPEGIAQPAGKPQAAHWLQYVVVSDVDAARSRAERLQGKLLGDTIDMKNVGRFFHVEDPLGARIGVIEPANRA